MSQIYNNPDLLRAFASKLESFRRDVQDQLNGLNAAMGRLGDTWEDDGFREFKEAFTSARTQVNKFVADTETVTPKLKAAADRLAGMKKLRAPR